MAVNLATKYSDKIAKYFTISSVVLGRTSKAYNWDGTKSIHVLTPVTQALGDYTRSGTSRYGTPTEMSDIDQYMSLSKDRSCSITIDKGNNSEQMNVKKAGEMLKAEIDEQIVPEIDAYALVEFADKAYTITAGTAPAADTIVGLLNTGMITLSKEKVPASDRVIFMRWTDFGYLLTCDEFLAIDKLGERSLINGTAGKFMGADVVPVPDSYMQKDSSSDIYFIIAHKSALLNPIKLREYNVKKDPPGISGDLIECRVIYDAFVLGAKAKGTYAYVESATQQTAPTNSYSSPNMTPSSSGASSIKYTTDGTDPRYSNSATSIATGTAVDLTAFDGTTVTFKSVALDGTLFTSAVTSTSQAVSV